MLLLDGVLINESTGSIGGGTTDYGVVGAGSPTTIINAGTIVGEFGGASLTAGGSIDNRANALLMIGGYGAGAVIGGGTGTVTNAGVVNGVGLNAGGSISNAAGGHITGNSRHAVYINAASGTITNAGTIDGLDGAALFAGGTIVNQAGARLAGFLRQRGVHQRRRNDHQCRNDQRRRPVRRKFHRPAGRCPWRGVFGRRGRRQRRYNTLELAAGTSATTGTLTNFGSQFTGFGTIIVDAGASWTVDRSDTLSAGVYPHRAAGRSPTPARSCRPSRCRAAPRWTIRQPFRPAHCFRGRADQ